MIGTTLHHPTSGITGIVDRISGHPDGKTLVRIDDHWLFRDECVRPRSAVFIVIAASALVGLGLYGLSLI
jgi:hypothetical protein